METKEKTRLQEIDALIRAGQLGKARKAITFIAKQRILPEERSQICSMANRLAIPRIPLLVLNRVVRPEGRLAKEATPEEIMEYAAALTMVGAYQEAGELLKSVDGAKYPKAVLYLAFNCINRWDYDSSLPLLQQYVNAPSLTDYEKLIGMVNLLAALVHEEKPQATHLLATLLKETKGKYPRLYLNLLIRGVENALQHRRWEEGREFLKEAKAGFSHPSGLEALFLRKWELFLTHAESPGLTLVSDFDSVREEARNLHHWETLRNLDLFQAELTHDEALFLFVYVGTPNTHYRKLIASKWKTPGKLPSHYDWVRGSGPGPVVELFSETNIKARGFKLGQTLSRLLSILCSDFYRPLRIAEISSQLYPGEVYNPSTTPHRLEQVVLRLRQQLEIRKQPIQIERKMGSYFVTVTAPCVMRVPVFSTAQSRSDVLLERLSLAFESRPFSTQDAVKILGMDRWSTLRVLNQGLAAHKLNRHGGGRSARYVFLDSNAPSEQKHLA